MQSKEFLTWLLTPKSAIFTTPFVDSKIFGGLMSRWITFCSLCKYSSPYNNWIVIKLSICSGIEPTFYKIPARLPAFMYSRAILMPFSVTNAPYDFMMFGWQHLWRVRNSEIIALLTLLSSDSCTSFSAKSFLVGLWIAFLTHPYAPEPSLLKVTMSFILIS